MLKTETSEAILNKGGKLRYVKDCQLITHTWGEDGDAAHIKDYFNLRNYDGFNLKTMCSEAGWSMILNDSWTKKLPNKQHNARQPNNPCLLLH